MTTNDPFHLESGLLDNVDVQIQDARFEFDPEYMDGQVLRLILPVRVEGDDFDDTEIKLSCGNGWTTNDGGETAEREDGKPRTFNKNSGVGRFVGSILELDGAEDALRAKLADGTAPEGPKSAALWNGMKLHVEQREVDYGGEIGVRDVLHASEWHGYADEAKKAAGGKKTAPAKGATKKAAAKSKGKAAGGDNPMTDDLRARLDKLADDCEDHDEFMERALADIAESGHPDVRAEIQRDDEGSIWDDAVKRYEATAE